jgi:hypothetical protein
LIHCRCKTCHIANQSQINLHVTFKTDMIKVELFNADILEGYETAEKGNRALFARLEALADMKYTYVISCQSFALQKSMNDQRYKDTIDLMIR